MATHRDVPVIVSPSDLRGRTVTREVAEAVRSGRARYVGLNQAEARRLLDARLATLAPAMKVDGIGDVARAFAVFGCMVWPAPGVGGTRHGAFPAGVATFWRSRPRPGQAQLKSLGTQVRTGRDRA